MRPIKPGSKLLGAVILGGGATGLVLGAAAVQEHQPADQTHATRQEIAQAQDLASVFRDVGKRVGPSVVEIQVRKTVKTAATMQSPQDFLRKSLPNFNFPDLPDQPNGDGGALEQVGTGSGFIVEVDGNTGYILTNNHVAGDASEITVTLADGRKIEAARLVGADPRTDLAVVKIEADGLKAAQLGNSADLQRGDWVMAFGAPFGYVGSMSHGIVSALDRTQVGILGAQGYEDFIQVDAPINPGNSGGPLVDLHGKVVGINAAIASRNGGFQGIGFAIPINGAQWVYHQLKDHGKVTRGWLGVAIADVSQARDVAKGVGYDKTTGVLVEQVVAGSPANGKLETYDVITAVNGKPVQSVVQLRNLVAEQAPGSNLNLSVFRNGKHKEVTLPLGTQPENMLASDNHVVAPSSGQQNAESLGMRLAAPEQELIQKFGLPDDAHGAIVTSVTPGSPAARAGIQPGDMITQVDRKPVSDAAQAADLIGKHSKKTPILLYVQNSQGGRIIAVEPKK
jgi:serine protease Do